jgi:acylpyruvate hydrolase
VKLATIRIDGTTRAVRIDGGTAVDLGESDLVDFLRRPDWSMRAANADGDRYEGALDYAPVVVAPEKVVCVGLNYRNHILEMGRELPQYPTLFSKYARALVGAYDDVILPASSPQMDWEAELAVVIGAEVRHADPEQARAAIAGYTVLNDVPGTGSSARRNGTRARPSRPRPRSGRGWSPPTTPGWPPRA